MKALFLCALAIGISALQVPLQNHKVTVLDSSSAEAGRNALISDKIEEFIHETVHRWNVPGVSVAVVRKDEEAPNGWQFDFGGYGIADAKGSPMNADSVFAIASNSKLFLAISVGLLISNQTLANERGEKLHWTTKISELIPEWKLMDDDMSRGVTLQDMLSHRTGMPRHDYALNKAGVLDMISTARYLMPSAELRQTFQYNNMMYNILSYLPQVLLNQTYESYIAQHLFEPLNMTASTFSVAVAEERGTFANGYLLDMADTVTGKNGTRTAMIPYFARPGEERTWAGAGGVFTSARDMATWVAMLMNNGRHLFTNKTVVPESILEHVAYGRSVVDGAPQFPDTSVKVYGAGQRHSSYQGIDVIEHGGSNPGFKSQVARFPNNNLGIITFCNDAGAGDYVVESIKFRIADEILGLKEIDWNNRFENSLKDEIKKTQHTAKPRPHSPQSPSAPFSVLAEKTFSNPAYGVLQLCLVPDHASDTATTSRRHTRCAALLRSHPVKRILSVSDTSVPTYIIPWERTFSTHIRLTHFTGNLFNATIIWTNSAVREHEGYGKGNDIVTGFNDRFEVEWVIGHGEEGLAFRGDFWGQQGPDVRAPEGKGKESAEVWFSTVL